MKNGFTFGKFLPFHLGHKAMLESGLEQCDLFTVIVCSSNSELIPGEIRCDWIRSEFPEDKKLEILEFTYDENELPNTSESSIDISEIWSRKFKELVPKANILFTSEDYGEYVSKFMNIEHVLFDKGRSKVPISASEIAKKPLANWDFLPDSVKRYFQVSIIFLGSECTGKSSLSKSINDNIRSVLVEEVGREVIEDSNSFGMDDLYEIATEHSTKIESAKSTLEPVILIDTDIHITQSYCQFKFGKYLDIGHHMYRANKGHLYIYLDLTLPFEQDGTRLDLADRLQLDKSHRNTLEYFEISYETIGGNWESRHTQILTHINQCITDKWALRK